MHAVQRLNGAVLLVFATVVIASLGMSSSAHATALTWNGTTGNASQVAKWSPSQLPGASDDLFFPGSTTFTITFDATVPTVLSHTYRNSVNATLAINNPHTATGTFSIGTVS